jgi:hypothetical protein
LVCWIPITHRFYIIEYGVFANTTVGTTLFIV